MTFAMCCSLFSQKLNKLSSYIQLPVLIDINGMDQYQQKLNIKTFIKAEFIAGLLY